MKRVWIAGFLLLVVTTAGIWNYFSLRSTVETLSGELSLAAEAAMADDLPGASEHTQAALRTFEQKHTYLSLVLSHQLLDLVTVSFDRAIQAAENDDFNQFMTESAELKTRISVLPESETPTLSNLF
ncbi:MAG: DUF4363 family protein [Butyricicoccaceae bacterium]